MGLPDVQQNNRPKSPRHLQRVGIQNVQVPMHIKSGINEDECYFVNAYVNLYTDLQKDVKGVSMSRFVRTIDSWRKKLLNNGTIRFILEHIRESIGPTCKSSYVRFSFKIPIMKKSICSGNEFPEYYKCFFEGRLEENAYRFFQCVKVPYASYCPCSAELCHHSIKTKGTIAYPHAQRSLASTIVQTIPPYNMWIEEIISTVELAVVNIPYPIILRKDEQAIAVRAATSPMFVEDAAREIANKLDEEKRIVDWLLKCEHFESIHTHEAVAILSKGIEEGLNPGYFLVQS